MSKISEQRLEEIKQLAAEGKLASHPTAGVTAHPQIQGRDPYYGLPALKPPVWTWEVPLYFFIGGISGVSAVIDAYGRTRPSAKLGLGALGVIEAKLPPALYPTFYARFGFQPSGTAPFPDPGKLRREAHLVLMSKPLRDSANTRA